MQLYGIDFTSTPTRKKPIVAVRAKLKGDCLTYLGSETWRSMAEFEDMLQRPGPWVAGMDFPFAQSKTLVENLKLPASWAGYVAELGALDRQAFRQLLTDYKRDRIAGDKHHRRRCDRLTRSQSPQTLYGTPVGLMFHEGAPRLLASGVALPMHRQRSDSRVALEAYPGFAARQLIGRDSYKSDNPRQQTEQRQHARKRLYEALTGSLGRRYYGLSVNAPADVCDDPSGDTLDALICTVQAGWGWQHRQENYGAPDDCSPLEGWICDPGLAVG